MWTLLTLLACDSTPTETDPDTDPATDTDTDVVDTDDTDIPAAEGDPATVELLGLCPKGDRWGGFRIDNGQDFGFIDGSVLLGVIPATIPEPVDIQGDCSLDRKLNPFCDPACPGGETCDLDGTCIPFPATQDLGTLEFAGTNPAVRIEPFIPGFSYSNTQVDNPPVDADVLMEMRMPNTPWGSLTLHAVGVQPLVTSGETLVVSTEEDLAVTWTAATGLGRSRVRLDINIDQHGNSPVLLSCDFDDDGTGTVPATLLDQLVNFGVSGFPSALVTRYTADQAVVGDDGCMELAVTSARTMDVRVDGFTPCNGPGQCPEGQECNLPLEICE